MTDAMDKNVSIDLVSHRETDAAGYTRGGVTHWNNTSFSASPEDHASAPSTALELALGSPGLSVYSRTDCRLHLWRAELAPHGWVRAGSLIRGLPRPP